MGNPVEFTEPRANFEGLSTQQASLGVAFAEELLYELDAAMEIEPEIDADFCKIHSCLAMFRTNDKVIDQLNLSNEWGIGDASSFDFDFNFPPRTSLSPTTNTRQPLSFSAVSSPKPQSVRQIFSPFSQFLN